MLCDSSQITTLCGSPPGRLRNLDPVRLSASKLYEITHTAAPFWRSIFPLVITCTLSLSHISGSHRSACSFHTKRKEEGQTTRTGQSSL